MRLLEIHILQSFPVSCLNRDDVGAPKSAIFGGVTRSRLSSQCIKRAIRLKAKELEADRPDKFFKGERTLWAADQLAKLLTAPPANWKLEPLANAEKVARTVCKGFVKDMKKAEDDAAAKAAEKDAKAAKKKADKEAKEAKKAAAKDDKGGAHAVKNAAEASPNPAAGLVVSKPPITKGADDGEEGSETKTLLYLSPGEIGLIAKALLQKKATVGTAEEIKAAISAAVNAFVSKAAECDQRHLLAKDVADIAIFGRMVAQENTVTLEGAGLFNHPLTTHKANNDIDYWTAVDDNSKQTHAGAANLGVSEHTSGVFYRYAAVNLDLLFSHMGEVIDNTDREHILKTFIQAVVLAIPSARDNSHNAHTEVGYAVGMVREHGQPLQLVNAFEKPVRASGQSGWIEPSVRAMLLHLQTLRNDYGSLVKAESEAIFGTHRPQPDQENGEDGRKLEAVGPNISFDKFCDQLTGAALPGGKGKIDVKS